MIVDLLCCDLRPLTHRESRTLQTVVGIAGELRLESRGILEGPDEVLASAVRTMFGNLTPEAPPSQESLATLLARDHLPIRAGSHDLGG